MMNCSCPHHLTGVTLLAAQNTDTSDIKQPLDETLMPVSPLRVAGSPGTDVFLGGLSIKAPRSNTVVGQQSASAKTQPLTATTQPLTAKSAGLLSSNVHFYNAVQEMSKDPEIKTKLDTLEAENETLLADSLKRFLESSASGMEVFSDKVQHSTAWVTDEKALFFKEYLFKTMHKHAKQPEMKLIAFEELQSEQAVKNRMLEALYKDEVTKATEICPPDLGSSGKHRHRNTLVMELTEVIGQNTDGSSQTGKPLRLFFASGHDCVPDTFFQRPTDQSSGSADGYQALLDVCAGVQGKNQSRKNHMGSEEFRKKAPTIFNKSVEVARNDGAILVLEFPMLKALGVLGEEHERIVARLPDSPKEADASSNARIADTEYMAMNFLLKMGSGLGLNHPKPDGSRPLYNLDLASRYPICRSCHLGMAVAVTDDSFPRLNEFNIAYGPEPQPKKSNKNKNVAQFV